MNLQKDTWTNADYAEFVTELRSHADERYRQFHLSLIPGSRQESYIGVRTPVMRSLAKEIAKGNARAFLAAAKDEYYEERIVRGMVSGLIKPNGFDELIALTEAQLPLIDSWALCDSFCSSLKAVKRWREPFFEYLRGDLLLRDDPWAQRTALVMMLNYYLDEEHTDEVLSLTDSVDSGEYYVQMAQAWLIATALAKCRDKTMAYLTDSPRVSDAVFNKAIQKATESYRVSDSDKAFLRTLKRK